MHILHQIIGAPKFKIQVESKTEAKLIISPLPAGFGMTLGNSLRRVLLSSLPGTAITAIKAEGMTHEYDTMKGVKDSLLDIILNLRDVVIKKHSKDVEVVALPLKKSGDITAKDLQVSSDIEILTPSSLITSCDGADAKKKIELRIEKGVGFRLIKNEDSIKEEEGFVLIDANFSPVKQVKYEVKPARVGDQINLDQLEVLVTTNGILEAEKAIKLSADILQKYFELFNNEDAYTDEDFTITFSALKRREEELKQASMQAEEKATPIDILGLSQRTLNSLVNGGITSVEKLQETPLSKLSQLRGFGQKAKTELEVIMSERGYQFGVMTSVEEGEEEAETEKVEAV
jgi:DNA-directed RNA polymerase subunit alpha